jgi:MTH538 TIR-like domain (DUF1863)
MHKVFVSYHHANDQTYRDAFERMFSNLTNVFISRSVQIGEISPYLATDTIRAKIRDEYLRDSTVTVVLIGRQTWQRKHVDWEIFSSIRRTLLSTRSGLLGIILPTHPSFDANEYDPGIVPPRLVDNQRCGFANIFHWTNDAIMVSRRIQDAFDRRNMVMPDNSREHFANNKFALRWCVDATTKIT